MDIKQILQKVTTVNEMSTAFKVYSNFVNDKNLKN